MDGKELRKWISQRYGPIYVLETDVCVFVAVPIYSKGVCLGVGGTLDLAIEDLKKDLAGGKTTGLRKQITT